MYGIDIYSSKNRHITIGIDKEKKFSLDIYQISTQDPPEELTNEFREGQFSTNLTSKQKLSLLKMLRKNRQAFAIGEQPSGKIRCHDIEQKSGCGKTLSTHAQETSLPRESGNQEGNLKTDQ
ncbi:hypothetical protein O181_029269 [Austropuccinia psidii MF-1]|uniref:Uncharacterized protein n=1 Tax=Austropuccinia psidii MF-1 TaxID=1389203 RepID=A0A9Q3CQK4_9BASI|nr:hypothetical protein [Austropuccinia psidii MF-1]